MVGARGEDWGRVILVCGSPPSPGDMVLVERMATTLALGQLITRQQQSLQQQAHATLISAILAQAHTDPDEAAVRARALGIQVSGRLLVTAVLRFRHGGPGGPGLPRRLGCWRWPRRWRMLAAASGFRRWWGRLMTSGSAPCCRWSARPIPTRCSPRCAPGPGSGWPTAPRIRPAPAAPRHASR